MSVKARFKESGLGAADSSKKEYQIDIPIGRGRKSIVYKAKPLFDLKNNRNTENDVALKTITEGSKHPEQDLKRLENEAKAMLSCQHTNIIKIYDYRTEGDSPYIAMEYAEYGDLRTLMDLRGKAFKVKDALIMMKQVALGLEAIHKVGVVHRDIKPDNILLTASGKIKIGDFGIAFLPTVGVHKDEANQGIGTFEYLAPECLDDGKCNQSTDVYSCAISLFELITGELPFAGSSFTQIVSNRMCGNVSSLSKYGIEDSAQIDAFFKIALSCNPRERFNTAAEFGKALSQLLKGNWRARKSNVLVMKAKAAPEEEIEVHKNIHRDKIQLDKIQREPKTA